MTLDPPTRPPPAPRRATDTVTLTIDGKPVTVPKGTNVLEAARTLGIDISAFCYHPGLESSRSAASAWSRSRRTRSSQPSCQQVGGDGMVVHTTDRRSRRSRASSSSSSRCSTTRSTARSATRRASARCRSCTSITTTPTRASTCRRSTRPRSSTSARTSSSIRSAASCARAASASCDEVAGEPPARVRQPRRSRGADDGAGRAARQPVLAQHRRRLPGRRADAKDFRFTMRAWELEATPSVCNGCATGCNIEIHHKHERVWRLVPRAQPGRQRVLDVRRGSVHVSATCASSGSRRALVDGLPAGWDRAIARRRKRLGVLLEGRRRRSASCFGAQSTNEDNFALAKLATSSGATKVYLAGRPPVPGRGDGRLRVADINPNTARRQGDRRGARPARRSSISPTT